MVTERQQQAGMLRNFHSRTWKPGIAAFLYLILAALALFFLVRPADSLAADCNSWNTLEFFGTAKGEDIRACLAAGANLNARNENGSTPLHIAVWHGNDPAVVATLLDAGANPNAEDENGRTPLHLAAGYNDSHDVTAVLVDAGADPNARDSHGSTPLHLAAAITTNPAVVATLLDAGADPSAGDDDNWTPWLAAQSNKNLRETDSWSRLEAAATARCEGWNTPEFFRTAREEDIHSCVAFGANPNARDKIGWTSLHMAAGLSEYPAIIAALVKAGADPNAREESKSWTPLHVAARFNKVPEIIAALVKAGADLYVGDEDGWSPIHQTAGRSEYPAIIVALVEAGADPNTQRTEDDWTPLHVAALSDQNPAMIAALVEAGADPNALDTEGWTPLHVAVTFSKVPATVAALIEAGADPNIRNNTGITPWVGAQSNDALRGTDAWSLLAAAVRPCSEARRGTYLSNVCWLVEKFSSGLHNYEVLVADEQACTVDIEPKTPDLLKTEKAIDNLPAALILGLSRALDRKGKTIYLNKANLREIRFETEQGMTCWSLSGEGVNGEGLDYVSLCGREVAHDRLNNAFSNLFAKYCAGTDSEF